MRWLLFVALAACADNTTLRFSELDDATINRLIGAALGGDAQWAAYQVFRFHDHSGDDPACPTVNVAETAADFRVTIVGGCTTRDGITVDGVARSRQDETNASYQFENYQVAGKTYDGSLRITETSEPKFELVADLTFDNTLHSSMHIDCGEESCRLAGGIELFGHGSVIASGTTRVLAVQVPSAKWQLRGEETLEVWSEDRPYACLQWRIAETGRTPEAGSLGCPR